MNYKEDVFVYDFETPKGCFLAVFFDIKSKEYQHFLINQYQNDLFKFVSFIQEYKNSKYFVGYNNIGFDAQVMEYIIDNHENWVDSDAREVSSKISEFGSSVIEAQKYNLFPPYKEERFTVKNIDLPRIWHFFNENRRVSLKQLEFEMRAPIIENFDIDVNKFDFTEEEVENLIFYCKNDVENTYRHYMFTIGETSHKLYKGKDKINDRIIVEQEVGLPCLNWDDVKIGAEWNKKDYLEMSGRSEKDLKPAKVNHYFGKKFKTFFPKTVEFKNEKVKNFVYRVLGESPALRNTKNKKQEFKFGLSKDLTITIAKGGIHSNEGPRFIIPNDDELYIQNDIGSQYPNAMRKYKIFPKHLGIEWNGMLVSKIARRLGFKKLYKETKDAKYNSLQEMGKLSLNGGAYGRLNTKGDWQEDPCAMMQVTIGCQLEILMTIEILLTKGFRIVSANTDGFDAIVPKNRLQEYFDTLEEVEKKIGNEELGKFELTVFEWIVQTSVNDYLAKKTGEYVDRKFIPGEGYKSKGDFEYEKELHKNTSFSIIPLALQKYYIDGIEVEDFINSHNDIYDFCARSNSGWDFVHMAYDHRNSEYKSYKLPKLIRYFVGKTGITIMKNVVDKTQSDANDTEVQPAGFKKVFCNRIENEDELLKLVNRQWYIDKTNETILKIKLKKKKLSGVKIPPKEQLNLF